MGCNQETGTPESIAAQSLESRTLSGSEPVGPSEDYKALLRGEITPEEYVRRLKADVDERMAQDKLYRRRSRLLRKLTRLSERLPGGYR